MKKHLPESVLLQLPDHQILEEIPQVFSDSTHRLWRLQTSKSNNPNLFLKVCSQTQSPFWQIMQTLFDFDLETEIIQFPETYRFIDTACSLEIPELKETGRSSIGSFVLTSELIGNACDSAVNDHMVSQLATHLTELHSLKSKLWGKLHHPAFTSDEWVMRLRSSLTESDKKWGGVFLNADEYLKKALSACDSMVVKDFVPMMPDLRWDQFLQVENKMSALVDLDAFVYAPRELDFVILEYILSESQIDIFKATYVTFDAIPDLEKIRPAYRLLLFYMQILGETDLDMWMKKPILFD